MQSTHIDNIELFYIAHGMKRSGNHALLNWIMVQGNFIFRNNILPIHKSLKGKPQLFKQSQLVAPNDFQTWLNETLSPEEIQNLILKHNPYTLIASLEDQDLNWWRTPKPIW